VVYLPLWKIVNWDDYSQYIRSHKKCSKPPTSNPILLTIIEDSSSMFWHELHPNIWPNHVAGIAYTYQILSGWWLTYPSEKWWSEKSVGIIIIIIIPNWMEKWKTCSKPQLSIPETPQQPSISMGSMNPKPEIPCPQYSTPQKPWFATAFQHTWACLGGV